MSINRKFIYQHDRIVVPENFSKLPFSFSKVVYDCLLSLRTGGIQGDLDTYRLTTNKRFNMMLRAIVFFYSTPEYDFWLNNEKYSAYKTTQRIMDIITLHLDKLKWDSANDDLIKRIIDSYDQRWGFDTERLDNFISVIAVSMPYWNGDLINVMIYKLVTVNMGGGSISIYNSKSYIILTEKFGKIDVDKVVNRGKLTGKF